MSYLDDYFTAPPKGYTVHLTACDACGAAVPWWEMSEYAEDPNAGKEFLFDHLRWHRLQEEDE